MSGLPRSPLGRGKHKVPVLIPRPDISNPAPDKQPPGGSGDLPTRNYLEATIRVKKLKPLARVKRRGWIQPGKWPTLWLEISKYIADTGYANKLEHYSKKQKQALQVCLHEMMHIALWDDLSITHAEDPDSILHYYVDGNTLEANKWDLANMKAAAKRIGRIYMNLDSISGTALYLVMFDAIKQWNEWIGREFFIIKKEE